VFLHVQASTFSFPWTVKEQVRSEKSLLAAKKERVPHQASEFGRVILRPSAFGLLACHVVVWAPTRVATRATTETVSLENMRADTERGGEAACALGEERRRKQEPKCKTANAEA
jgi:hypothetical protein